MSDNIDKIFRALQSNPWFCFKECVLLRLFRLSLTLQRRARQPNRGRKRGRAMGVRRSLLLSQKKLALNFKA